MQLLNLIEAGDRLVMDAIQDVTYIDYMSAGAAGLWSVQDIIAHLASYEKLTLEVLERLTVAGPTPTLDRWVSNMARFDDDEVLLRAAEPLDYVVSEYMETHALVIDAFIRIPKPVLHRRGRLDWYGADRDTEDFLIEMAYAHKREHAAQIDVFKYLTVREAAPRLSA